MYNHDVKVAGGYLADGQTVPQNTSADGNGGAQQISGTMGGIEVIVKAKTDIAIADTKVLSVKLQESSDNGVSDSFADLATIYTVTASGATTLAAGTTLAKFIVPTDAERYIKAIITTDDASATGTIDVYPRYLPR